MPQHVFHGVSYWLTDFWCILPCRVCRYAKLDTAHSNVDSKQPLTNGCLGVCSCEIILVHERQGTVANMIWTFFLAWMQTTFLSTRTPSATLEAKSVEPQKQEIKAPELATWHFDTWFAFCCWRHASKSPGLSTQKPIEPNQLQLRIYGFSVRVERLAVVEMFNILASTDKGVKGNMRRDEVRWLEIRCMAFFAPTRTLPWHASQELSPEETGIKWRLHGQIVHLRIDLMKRGTISIEERAPP